MEGEGIYHVLPFFDYLTCIISMFDEYVECLRRLRCWITWLPALIGSLRQGYPEFEQAPELPYPVDKFGAQKHGITLPSPPEEQQKKSWFY